MESLTSRYNQSVIYYLILGFVSTFLISLFLLQIFAALLALLWLFEKNKQKIASLDLIGKFLLLFLVARLIAVLFSEYPKVSEEVIYREVLFYLSFFALNFYLKVLEREKVIKILSVFINAGVVVSLIGIYLFVFNHVHRAQSITSGYSTFSSYLLVILIFMLVYGPSKEKTNKSLMWILKLSLIITALVISLGRTNIFVAAFILVIFVLSKKVNWQYILIGVLLAAAFSYASFHFNNKELESRVKNPTTLSDRDIIFKGFEMRYKEHPLLGFGPRTFREIFPLKNQLKDKGVASWHNLYIEIYMESGLLGLLSFFALMFAIFYQEIKDYKNRLIDQDSRKILLSVITSNTALFLAALTGGFIFSPILSLQFAFLLSLGTSVNYGLSKLKS